MKRVAIALSASAFPGLAGCGGGDDDGGAAGTTVRTAEFGQLEGVVEADGNSVSWRGVPFAKPPVGALRWQPTQAPDPWTGVRSAKDYADACSQIGGLFGPPPKGKDYSAVWETFYKQIGSEDCLYLNVWSPTGSTDASKLPVIVYIHGGSNVVGAAFDPLLLGFNDWGQWWQGEIAGEYFLSNSNLISHELRVHVAPNDSLGTGLLFFQFKLDRPASLSPIDPPTQAAPAPPLATVVATDLRVMLPARSRASMVTVWPASTLAVVSHGISNGGAVTTPSVVPSTMKRTDASSTSSVADARTLTVPATTAPDAGATIETAGATESPSGSENSNRLRPVGAMFDNAPDVAVARRAARTSAGVAAGWRWR